MIKSFLIRLMLLTLFTVTFFTLSSCSKTKHGKIPEYNDANEYIGFSDIPEDYTDLQAKEDNCYVIISDSVSNSKPEVFGEEHWSSFYEASAKGKEAFMRVAHFIDGEGYYQDLYYHKDKYYLHTKNEYGINTSGPYDYLRALEGMDGIPKRERTIFVLTDSLELTYKDVMWKFLSSNTESVTKIPFDWLGFTSYLNTTAVE